MLDIVIDVTSLQDASSNPILFVWEFFRHGGWIVPVVLIVVSIPIILYQNWLLEQQKKFLGHHHHIMLAIDVPKGNEQTPKAVESVFAHLHGLHKNPALIETLQGFVVPEFSLEIVGLEGQTQFLIRCTDDARALVESTIYAQYPDAAITEVRDYTDFVPKDFAAAGYDLWGCEIVLANKTFYPIKTYPFFEHSMSQQFLDPMSSLLELFAHLGPTEQVWLQLVVSPIDSRWTKAAEHEVKKIIGEKEKHKVHPAAEIAGNVATGLYQSVTSTIVPPGGGHEDKKPEKQASFTYLPPGEQEKVKGIQMKITKLGYEVKFRMIYIAKKEYMNKTTGVNGVIGALKQFNTQDMNAFKPESTTKTTINYFFKKYRVRKRKERILENYRRRALHKKFQLKNPLTMAASKPFILNTEELASVFHFPVEPNVKAPMVQKTEAKRGEPPISLPVEPLEPTPPGHGHGGGHGAPRPPHRELPATHGTPPDNLPLG